MVFDTRFYAIYLDLFVTVVIFRFLLNLRHPRVWEWILLTSSDLQNVNKIGLCFPLIYSPTEIETIKEVQ
jgi:hypothetical protein